MTVKPFAPLLALAAASALAAPALATPVDYYSVLADDPTGSLSNTLQANPVSAVLPGAAATASNANHGTVTAQVTAGFDPVALAAANKPVQGADALAIVNFQITVSGPATTGYVPLNVGAALKASGLTFTDINGKTWTPGDVNAPPFTNVGFTAVSDNAQFAMRYDSATLESQSLQGRIGALPVLDAQAFFNPTQITQQTDAQSIAFDQTVMVLANQPIDVTLTAEAGYSYKTGGDAFMSAFAAASVDPTFTITNPDFAAYSVEGVPDGPATSPGGVPEPAAWALMILGFGAAGGALRRRAAAARFI